MKFSFLIPSYNRPQYIREAVQSLLANNAPDIEIIVSDDASPKRAEIKGALADFIDDGRVHYIQQEANLRWSENRNALLRAARGEYVILLGDDDRFKPNAVERLRYWTGRHPDVAIFGIGYDAIDERGGYFFSYYARKPLIFDLGNDFLLRELVAWDFIPMWSHHPFTMCSKRAAALALSYNPKVDIADDVIYMYDALQSGHKILVIPEALFEWRSVTISETVSPQLSSELRRCDRSRGLILAEMLRRNDLSPKIKKLFDDVDFLMDFCHLSRGGATELQARLRGGEPDGTALADFIERQAALFKPTFFRKVRRVWRGSRILGPSHVYGFFQERSKRRRLGKR